jgi:hypothetical protein
MRRRKSFKQNTENEMTSEDPRLTAIVNTGDPTRDKLARKLQRLLRKAEKLIREKRAFEERIR